jgi:glycerol-3-phosphate O-acyltransferase
MPGRPFPPDPTLPLADEPTWPDIAADRPVLVLADAPTKLERRLVRAWIARHRPEGVQSDLLFLLPSRRRRSGHRTDPAVSARLQRGDDAWVLPVRVVWRATERNGRRSAGWTDILKLGDPRDPDPIRGSVILWKDPDRVSLVAGAGAGAGELIAAHQSSVEAASLIDFVTRRAHLSLERAERGVRGNRYKVPRFVNEEILSRSEFRDGVLRVASATGMPPEIAFARARYYLREMAASHSPFLIDLIANAIHWVYRQGYGAIVYDADAVKDIAALGQEHPIVFLPSHRSNLDKLSLQYLLWENDLPPNHTAAGINMNFFPVGPLIRRTGSFFIRRSFKDNELYKYVVRSYLDYLVERRFPLEWYMEGGRSRSGKLLPPKYGMLGWVVESVQRGKSDDLYVIPTSIAYDQIQDVADYASEAQGGQKKKESFGWAFSAVRSLRQRYGNIHVRFAEPLSVRKEIPTGDDDEVSIELQKLAFEVMYRISRVTPITPTSVVTIALLSTRGRSLDAGGVASRAAEIDAYIDAMGFPVTEPLRLEQSDEVERVVAQLAEHGSVTTERADGTTLYRLDSSQALQAAYYRNTIVHFFVPGAIAELAALGAEGPDPIAGLWEQVFAIRDLLKFEFFFPEREAFRRQVTDELSAMDAGWEHLLAGDRTRLIAGAPVLRAHWALLPFLESYQIVADRLLTTGDDAIDEKTFLASCLELGRRYRLEGRVGAEESVSQVLFKSALDLARNRGLAEPGPGIDALRRAWADEIARLRSLAERVATAADRRLG